MNTFRNRIFTPGIFGKLSGYLVMVIALVGLTLISTVSFNSSSSVYAHDISCLANYDCREGYHPECDESSYRCVPDDEIIYSSCDNIDCAEGYHPESDGLNCDCVPDDNYTSPCEDGRCELEFDDDNVRQEQVD